jgi:hypothetical protein
MFTVFSPAHQDAFLEPQFKLVGLRVITDMDVTAKGTDVLMVDFTARPDSVWDTPCSCIKYPVVHMYRIRSSFCPEGERQAGVGEKSTDSTQDGQMSLLDSAVLRMSIRGNFVGKYTVVCKQFLKGLRGELGSIVCRNLLDDGLAMVLDQCNIFVGLLQGFRLGFHAGDPDVLGVIIIAGQEVLAATMRI